MADDSGVPPLPRRVPGATVSPGTPVPTERFVIPEDLRQRVLTAIADELRRDEAEERRRAQEQGAQPGPVMASAGDEAHPEEAQAGGAVAPAAPDRAGLRAPAPDSADHQAAASAPSVWSPVPRPANLPPPALDREAHLAAASAPTVWSPVPRPKDLMPPALDPLAHRTPAPDQADPQAPAADQPDPRPVVPLPRRTPGMNGAPPPPAHVRREFLPPSLLGQRFDVDFHTEPLPKITWFGTGAPAAPEADHRAEDPAAALTLPAGAPSLLPKPPGSAPPDSREAGPAPSAGVFPEPAQPGAGPSVPGVPGRSGPGPDARPPEPEGPRVPSSEPSPPITPPAVAASSAPAAPPDLVPEAPPPAVQGSPTAPAGPGPAGPAPAASPAPPGSPRYSWPPDQHAKKAGNRAVIPAPAAPSAGKKGQGSGRRYRVAGLLVAVIVLIAAAAVALLLSGRSGAAGNGHRGLGAPGAGAGERNLAAAWVAGQVSRTAVVACDPAMCRVLAAHGVSARVLYPLGPATASPLHSKIIVVTAQVRAKFGNLLGSVYAPAVLASFGSGAQRVEIRQTVLHGAAAYRAALGADLLRRKASGAELLRNNRIATAPIARREVSAGRVDSRLLIAIAGMASMHPVYIINFGSAAPGADPDLPLRFADLSETGSSHSHFDRSAGYVRSMMSFLRAQRMPFRPAHTATVVLARGTRALRIEFPAPSPLGLLGLHRPNRGTLQAARVPPPSRG